MPPEGLDWMPDSERLSNAEVVRLITIAVQRLGVEEVRFTGGEPLMRRGLESIVAAVARLTPRPDISLTTNGIGLDKRAEALAAAGVNRLNVSLDTLHGERFRTLTGRDRLIDVLAGMAAAKRAGLLPLKINTVLLRGINDDEPPELLQFAITNGFQLRFIEQMPLDAQHEWDRRRLVDADAILASLRTRFTLTPDYSRRGAAPAELWHVNGGPAKVGVIASVTRPFCGNCDRTRLTADGQIRSCLFATSETDVRGPLRSGATDEEIAERWRDATWAKLPGHGINEPDFHQPQRPMSAIGG
jgi:cyclic pyranopterin phosphate synthase